MSKNVSIHLLSTPEDRRCNHRYIATVFSYDTKLEPQYYSTAALVSIFVEHANFVSAKCLTVCELSADIR